MKLYKLTDENDETMHGTKWGAGVTHKASGEGDLCGPGWIHAYEDPLVAVLMNPIHADFENPHLWEAEGEIGTRDGQLKCGCKSLTTVRRMELPVVTVEQNVRFGVMCALEVCDSRRFVEWAKGWLAGEDRSLESAAERQTEAAWAAWAARAARAAEAAARALALRKEAEALAEVEAAWAAEAAVEATLVADERRRIDIIAIAHRAVSEG